MAEINEWAREMTPEHMLDYECLTAEPPKDVLQADSARTQMWRLWLLRRSPNDQCDYGYIKLDVKPDGDINAEQCIVQHPYKSFHETRAAMQCDNDALRSLQYLRMVATCKHPPGDRKFPEMDVKIGGKVDDGNIMLQAEGGKPRNIPVAGGVVSNWSILDAVQHLPGADTKPVEFTFLDEIDKVKPGHRLRFLGKSAITFGGIKRPVYEYFQSGYGLLPWRYYVDAERSHLLLAINGLRALILDQNGDREYNAQLQRFGRRGQ
jgi:hypothetical protein